MARPCFEDQTERGRFFVLKVCFEMGKSDSKIWLCAKESTEECAASGGIRFLNHNREVLKKDELDSARRFGL